MCRVTSPLSRRTVLRGGLALAGGVAATSLLASCDRGPTPEQITAAALLPLAEAALADQAAAHTLSGQVTDYTRALQVIASQRGEHARALREEITRLDQRTAERIATAGASSSSEPTTSAPPTPNGSAATMADFRQRLTRSARTSGDACVNLNGYAAGLAGAISASVTSMVEVQLA